jgi:uridylate kinase
MEKNNFIILSLGGSIIVPNQINSEFLKKFILTIKKYIEKGYRFIIITGGGRTCRSYNDSLKQVVKPTSEDLDWLGIQATRLNAELVRICFQDLAYEKVLLDPDMIPDTDKPIIVGGGWKPGNSSDLAAIRSAVRVGASKVINLSNVDFAYNKDPKVFPDAKIMKNTSWKEFRAILPDVWVPGINVPFDPIAAREAEENGLEVVIMNGQKLENLTNYLDGQEFVGSIIK